MTYTTNSPKTRKHVPAGTVAIVAELLSKRDMSSLNRALNLTSRYYGTDSHEVVSRTAHGQLDSLA
jgi:hypothetical protein